MRDLNMEEIEAVYGAKKSKCKGSGSRGRKGSGSRGRKGSGSRGRKGSGSRGRGHTYITNNYYGWGHGYSCW